MGAGFDFNRYFCYDGYMEKVLKTIIWLGFIVICFACSLYIAEKMYFPFIVGKTLVFRVTVELIFLAFLWLTVVSRDYKLKFNTISLILLAYLFISLISSLLGDDFLRSFWSNNERSEGLLLLIHLFLFFLILTNFLRSKREWLWMFDIFFAASLCVALYALAQYLNLPIVMASSGGSRLAGTLGNAGYMAGYLIFAIYIGLFLALNRNIKLMLYYLPAIALQIFITVLTYTRGGIIALGISAFIFIIYFLFYYLKDLSGNSIFNRKHASYLGVAVIVISLLFPVYIWSNKEASFVKSNPILSRLTSISLTDVTASNRLLTWQSSWQGFLDRPLLGWGQENFYQVFDKYFKPEIHRKAHSVVWFDRAHNLIFDRLVTGGLVGLLTYLAFLLVPVYLIWKKYWKLEQKNKYLTPMIISLIILAYFIQNLFIFEALVTYIPLFLVIGFASMYSSTKFAVQEKTTQTVLLIIYLILILPMMYTFNIRPVQANLNLVKALAANDVPLDKRMLMFDQVFAMETMGNEEYRKQYYTFFMDVMDQFAKSGKFSDPQIVQGMTVFAQDVELKLAEQLKDNDHSAMNYIMLLSFNNHAAMFNPERLQKNIEIFDQAIQYSPNRQQFYIEMGDTYLRLSDYYGYQKQGDLAQEAREKSLEYFKQASNLNPANIDFMQNLATSYMLAENFDQARETAARVIEASPGRQEWYANIMTQIEEADQ